MLLFYITFLWREFYKSDNEEEPFNAVIKRSLFGNITSINWVINTSQGSITQRYNSSIRLMPFDPVLVVDDKNSDGANHLTLPAIAVYFLGEEGISQQRKDVFFTSVNIALFAVGVGELIAGIRGTIQLVRYGRFLSGQLVRSFGTTSLGLIDVLASFSSEVCNFTGDDPELKEFCRNWEEYEAYVNGGLLSITVSKLLLSKLSSSYTSKVRNRLNSRQREFLENDLKVVKGADEVFKVITTDINVALNNRIAHIRSIKFEPKGSGYRFSGCHSKSAIDELGANARLEITIPKNAEGVYEGKVFAKGPDGKEIMKSGNGGKSTFFPDHWDEARILDEVEFAVKNNKGQVPNGASNQYFGFSKDGKIKIEFYYNETTGAINSFFPSLNPY